MNTINEIHTSCKECIFAKYKGKTQVDCRLNLFQIAKNKLEIILAYDSEKEFHVLNNTKCLFKRTTEWAGGLNISECINVVEKESQLKYHIIIVNDGVNKQIDQQLNAINSLSIKPIMVTILNLHDNSFTDYTKLDGNGYEWKIQNILYKHYSLRKALDIMSDANYHKEYLYYMVLDAKSNIDDTRIKELNYFINYKMNNVGYIPQYKDFPMVVYKPLHHFHGGNSFFNLEKKIDNKYHFKWEEIC